MSTTPNMSLTVPEPLVTTGPTYATQINAALDVIDAHDHSPGKGVKITPSGMNINGDLAFNQNSAINLKSVVLAPQASVATNAALYNIGGDLFYRRGDGTQVQITTASGVNVSGVGGITGLVAPASAVYTPASSLFSWLSAAATFAKQATGDLSIYSRSGAIGVVQAVTLVADVGTSAYSLYLPATGPTDNQFMRMVAAGASKFVDLLGTNNQVTVTHNGTNTTLSLPQNIHTAATPTFAGLTLTGTLNGTAVTLSGALSAASGSLSGNLTLTGAVGSVISAPNYALSVLGMTADAIAPLSGTEILCGGDLRINVGRVLKVNTIAQNTGTGVTINGNTILGGTLSLSFPLTSSSSIASSSLSASTLNIASSATIINSFGITTNQVTVPTISNAINGVEISARTSSTPYPSFTVGEVINASPAGDTSASTSYQNVLGYAVPAGVWRITAIIQFQFTALNNFGGGGNGSVYRVEAALSQDPAFVTDQPYYVNTNTGAQSYTTGTGQGFYASGDVVTMSISRRWQSNSTTNFYIIGKTRYDSLHGSNIGKFTAAGCQLIIERVG